MKKTSAFDFRERTPFNAAQGPWQGASSNGLAASPSKSNMYEVDFFHFLLIIKLAAIQILRIMAVVVTHQKNQAFFVQTLPTSNQVYL